MSKAINPMLLCDFYKTVHSDSLYYKITVYLLNQSVTKYLFSPCSDQGLSSTNH